MVDCFIDYITWIDFDKFTMVNLGNSFAMRSCSGYESVSGIRNPGMLYELSIFNNKFVIFLLDFYFIPWFVKYGN